MIAPLSNLLLIMDIGTAAPEEPVSGLYEVDTADAAFHTELDALLAAELAAELATDVAEASKLVLALDNLEDADLDDSDFEESDLDDSDDLLEEAASCEVADISVSEGELVGEAAFFVELSPTTLDCTRRSAYVSHMKL